MGKAKKQKDLSDLALALLAQMAENPSRLEYNTRVLGGIFQNEHVVLLDRAYADLLGEGLVEKAGAVVSYFGAPKSLVRISEKGLKLVEKQRQATQKRNGEHAR